MWKLNISLGKLVHMYFCWWHYLIHTYFNLSSAAEKKLMYIMYIMKSPSRPFVCQIWSYSWGWDHSIEVFKMVLKISFSKDVPLLFCDFMYAFWFKAIKHNKCPLWTDLGVGPKSNLLRLLILAEAEGVVKPPLP